MPYALNELGAVTLLSGAFTEAETIRYARNMLLREIGPEGQRKIRKSSVLTVGAGGISSASLYYLAAAGIGRLGLVDDDHVELSNLQRQILHGTSDIGRLKVDSAKDAIIRLNPHCKVDTWPVRLDETNASDIIRQYDFILDGSDNFHTRYIVADTCYCEKRWLIWASAVGFEGLLFAVHPGIGEPCLRCLAPDMPGEGNAPVCRETGILGAVAGVMGSLQAIETLKLIIDAGEDMASRLLAYDALRSRFTILNREPDPACPICGSQAGDVRVNT